MGDNSSCFIHPVEIANKTIKIKTYFELTFPSFTCEMSISRGELRDKIFSFPEVDFVSLAMDIFRYQYDHNLIYQKYCQTLKRAKVLSPESVLDIPFLPVSMFKSHAVQSGNWHPTQIFQSSATGGKPSVHAVRDMSIYFESFWKCFQRFYGEWVGSAVVGLLPSYLERKGSSLITMISELITQSNDGDSGFYLYNQQELSYVLIERERQHRKTLLFGVTFALLDFAKNFRLQLPNTIIIETGGMKGRGQEPTREEVHKILRDQLGVSEVHSEYGMTEMFSQAYMQGSHYFNCPPWLQPVVREHNDPLSLSTRGKGLLNFIDLANLDTCSFIATDDLGEVHSEREFIVSGRADYTEMRGCNLMVTDFFPGQATSR